MSKLAAATLLAWLGGSGLVLAQAPAPPAAPQTAELERARAELERAAREVAQLSAANVENLRRNLVLLHGRRPLLGLNIDNAADGVRVAGVTPGGPAAEAGIATGDVIVAVDGTALESTGRGGPTRHLLDLLAELEAGSTVNLEVRRDGNTLVVPVVTSTDETAPIWIEELRGLGPAIRDSVRVATPNGFNRAGRLFVGPAWRDMELVELTPALGAYFATDQGLLVVRAPEDDTIPLRDGDVILSIGGREPASVDHAMKILASFEPGETLEIEMMREQRRRTLTFEMPAREDDFDVRLLR